MTATLPQGLLEWARMHTGARREVLPEPEVVAGDASNRRYFRLRLPDRSVILDTGQVVFDGLAKEVLDNADLRQEYLAI